LPDGTAAAVGLSPGDVILRVNRVTVRNMNDFSLEMEKIAGGETVEIEILRISVGLFGQMQRRYVVQLKVSPAPSKAETL
jgi:S1-C subfamily serine protease